jgi:hypothetical protein
MATATENGHRITAFGEAALTGWRGMAGRAIAKPVARRTRFTQEQVETVIGLTLVAYALYRVLRPLIGAARSR